MDDRDTIGDLINYLSKFNPEARIVNQLTFCWSNEYDGEYDLNCDGSKEGAESVTIYSPCINLLTEE